MSKVFYLNTATIYRPKFIGKDKDQDKDKDKDWSWYS